MPQNCLICDKHCDTAFDVYRNEFLVIKHFVRRPEQDDNYLGYYMIESRRHFKGVYDATEDEAAAFGEAVRMLSKAMKRALGCEHVYVFVLGDGIPHLHFHVVAKYHGAPREFLGPKVDEWPQAPRGGVEQVKRINEAVMQALT